jgi:hypothetical protein
MKYQYLTRMGVAAAVFFAIVVFVEFEHKPKPVEDSKLIKCAKRDSDAIARKTAPMYSKCLLEAESCRGTDCVDDPVNFCKAQIESYASHQKSLLGCDY